MFYVNDEPESTFLYTETIKLYCTVFRVSVWRGMVLRACVCVCTCVRMCEGERACV